MWPRLPAESLRYYNCVVAYENVVYTGDASGFLGESEAKARGLTQLKLSGTEFRRLLRSGEATPDWFAFKSVIGVLREEERRGGKAV